MNRAQTLSVFMAVTDIWVSSVDNGKGKDTERLVETPACHCEEQSDEAIQKKRKRQGTFSWKPWIAAPKVGSQ